METGKYPSAGLGGCGPTTPENRHVVIYPSDRYAYTGKAVELDAYAAAFQCESEQRGSLVLSNGEPVGLDVISRNRAYDKLHPSRIKGYAMDALVRQKDNFDDAAPDKALAFLYEVEGCKASPFESVGGGVDYRFEGTGISGSALVCDDRVVHLEFFRLD